MLLKVTFGQQLAPCSSTAQVLALSLHSFHWGFLCFNDIALARLSFPGSGHVAETKKRKRSKKNGDQNVGEEMKQV
jgi:hypothetical protein